MITNSPTLVARARRCCPALAGLILASVIGASAAVDATPQAVQRPQAVQPAGSPSAGSPSAGSPSAAVAPGVGGGNSLSAKRKKPAKRRDPKKPATLNWAALARCESGGNPRAVNRAGYYGLYQFSPRTWRSVGGRGMPHRAKAAEQTSRAQLLYKRSGSRPWPTCGRRLFT